MAFGGWTDERLEEVEKGLLLLGWQADGRLTSSEGEMIEEIARKALDLERAHALTAAAKDQLAVEAFEIMSRGARPPGGSFGDIFFWDSAFFGDADDELDFVCCWTRG